MNLQEVVKNVHFWRYFSFLFQDSAPQPEGVLLRHCLLMSSCTWKLEAYKFYKSKCGTLLGNVSNVAIFLRLALRRILIDEFLSSDRRLFA